MNGEVQRIEPEEARVRLESDDGWVYLDVRTVEEFQAGHVPGAVCIPFLVRDAATGGMRPNPEFVAQVESRFQKGAKVIVGCQRGVRSLRAASVLAARGFTEVVDMRGGYDGELDPSGAVTYAGWRRRGLPTSTE